MFISCSDRKGSAYFEFQYCKKEWNIKKMLKNGIILIKNPDVIADPKGDFDFQVQERRGRRSLQGLIKDFKSVTTRQYKAMFQVNESLWQESYYDEVIRSQEKYHEIWNYIEHNPARWIMKENH